MSSTAPNVGLTYQWSLGESGYNVQMDENLLVIDSFLIPTVISSTVDSPPVNPSQGDRYIVPSTPVVGSTWESVPGYIVVYSGTQWLAIAPKNGWLLRDSENAVWKEFDGLMWVQVAVTAGGADGSFTSADGKTITVVGGVITDIAV